MNKVILALFVLVACVSSSKLSGLKCPGFFEGLCDPLGLEDAYQELGLCFNQAIPDLENSLKGVIADIKAKNMQGAFYEVLMFVNSLYELKNYCPAGVEPFIKTLWPLVEAFLNNEETFVKDSIENLGKDAIQTVSDVFHLISDTMSHDCTQAGEDFGGLLAIAFSTWIPQTAASETSGESSISTSSSPYIFDLAMTTLNNNEASNIESSEGSGTEFFEGFASAFGLQTAAQDLINCVEVDPSNLISDIGQLISDIQNSNWSGVVTDAVEIYSAIQALSSNCPDGAEPFINEFAPVIEAINNNDEQFLETVGENIKNNLAQVMGDLGQLIEDINNSDYYDAGAEFGNIQVITLAGILPNNTMTHHH